MNCNLVLIVLAACIGSIYCYPPTSDIQTSLHRFNNKTYYIETLAKADFYRSFMFCQKINMRLVTVDSNEEFEKLVELIKKSVSFTHGAEVWTSATDLSVEGSFLWMSTGLPMNVDKWLPKEPNNAANSEHCMAFRNEGDTIGFNDNKCWTENYFICESVPSQC
ncbi:PREDICTED: C-type lectin 37Da-like [Nicrophorus vespilloides]|uniref:C-type lectin 37Da-like n=1 Tax=Nicrophorus vespilloides TaxID=110193 RepID=A0ABM1MFB9_NICVS|nr:PREDICTED: C-type lectin 37Da-like [Nicrophorus vespilloides]